VFRRKVVPALVWQSSKRSTRMYQLKGVNGIFMALLSCRLSATNASCIVSLLWSEMIHSDLYSLIKGF